MIKQIGLSIGQTKRLNWIHVQLRDCFHEMSLQARLMELKKRVKQESLDYRHSEDTLL